MCVDFILSFSLKILSPTFRNTIFRAHHIYWVGKNCSSVVHLSALVGEHFFFLLHQVFFYSYKCCSYFYLVFSIFVSTSKPRKKRGISRRYVLVCHRSSKVIFTYVSCFLVENMVQWAKRAPSFFFEWARVGKFLWVSYFWISPLPNVCVHRNLHFVYIAVAYQKKKKCRRYYLCDENIWVFE